MCKPLVSSHKIIIYLIAIYFAEDYYIQIRKIGLISDMKKPKLPQSCNVRDSKLSLNIAGACSQFVRSKPELAELWDALGA